MPSLTTRQSARCFSSTLIPLTSSICSVPSLHASGLSSLQAGADENSAMTITLDTIVSFFSSPFPPRLLPTSFSAMLRSPREERTSRKVNVKSSSSLERWSVGRPS